MSLNSANIAWNDPMREVQDMVLIGRDRETSGKLPLEYLICSIQNIETLIRYIKKPKKDSLRAIYNSAAVDGKDYRIA